LDILFEKEKHNMTTKHSVVLTLFVACLVPGSVWAAALTFDDTSPNETITVTANDFESGLAINGSPFQQGLGNPASITLPETGRISFSGTWITFNQQPPAAGIMYLIESPNDPLLPPPLVSDIFQYQIVPNTDGTATISGFFESDLKDNLGTLPGGIDPRDVFLENGTAIGLGFIGLGISVSSDVDIPEPATFSLLAGGLVLLARRRRTT
jgi:hypothetical protein